MTQKNGLFFDQKEMWVKEPIKPPFAQPSLQEIDEIGAGEEKWKEPECVECDGAGAIAEITCFDCSAAEKER